MKLSTKGRYAMVALADLATQPVDTLSSLGEISKRQDISLPYLEQLFGPGAEQAVERYRTPDRELLAVLQLYRRSNQIISRYEIKEGPKVYEAQRDGKKYEMYDDTVIAFNRSGKEIFRTQVEEPVHVRPAKQANSI